jgi:3,4-dihydroxy 2-butanone 4-phosphate synthase/GTP cyclohydrolase II
MKHLQEGKMVILVDDEDRENEGDLVLAAEFANAENINFMIKHARGLVCLSLESKRVDELSLPMMAQRNETPRQTAFTVSIEARHGVSTGISSADRAHTIRVAVDPKTQARDLISPGHVFPLKAQSGGVLVRAGHTEGSIDLCKLASLAPSAVICEIMKDDGSMARMSDLREFGETHSIPIVTIQEVIARRMENEVLVEKIAESTFPNQYSSRELKLIAFKSIIDGSEHLAIVNNLSTRSKPKSTPLVRMHSECLTGDALGSLRCDCGPQLRASIQQIAESDSGVVVYLRNHEGRGIGLGNKIRAYELQDQGLDTVEANHRLGFAPDLRHYGIGAQILRSLGVTELKLLTNNPRKIVGIHGYGLKVVERIPILTPSNPHNEKYLDTKQNKLQHDLERK